MGFKWNSSTGFKYDKIVKPIKEMEIDSWDEAAYWCLCNMYVADGRNLKISKPFDEHEKSISNWVLGLQEGKYSKDDISLVVDIMKNAGEMAIAAILRKNIPFYVDEMTELLCRKQHDYGHENINNFGVLGLAIRMCDKFARIKNLEKRGADGKNESLHDSYLDVVGYATIAMMYYDGTFQLKLEKDK
jgi:hypothetical protein